MDLEVKPSLTFRGEIELPASKSYSIRGFLVAACGGKSDIICPSDCDDAVVARKIAASLGAKVRKGASNQWSFDAGQGLILDQGPRKKLREYNVGESGTALRFLLPLVALKSESAVIRGRGTLKGRPNLHLTKLLRRQGVDVRGHGIGEGVPIRFAGGLFNGGVMEIDATLSSQFVSALLIACPQLAVETRLILTGQKLVSMDYIDMTINILKLAGVSIHKDGAREFLIPAHQKFKGLKKFIVPSDYGLAAFHLAAAALHDSEVVLKGHLNQNLIQADGRIMDLLKKLGVRFQATSRSIKLSGPFNIKGGKFSLKDCPDLVPIMSVLALFADQPTILTDIGHVRVKESDRISDLRQELLKTGAVIHETRNTLTVKPLKNPKTGILLDPHHDHRLAMAFCILGSKIGARVRDINCVRKSYPGFVRDFRALGGKTRQIR